MKMKLLFTPLLLMTMTFVSLAQDNDFPLNGDALIFKKTLKFSNFNNSSSDGLGIGFYNNSSLKIYSDAFIYFMESDSMSTKISFDLNNARLGIGTTSPSFKLHVSAGNANTHAKFIGNFSGPQGIQVERSGGDNIRLVANYSSFGGGLESSSALRFAVNGNNVSSPAMYVKSNGFVGIGTTDPDMQLTIQQGNLNVGGTGNGQIRTRHINGKDHLSQYYGALLLNYHTSHQVQVGSAANQAPFYVLGNVGVGTNSPQNGYRLTVDGKAIMEEVKVQILNGPDYVFESDYNLRTLAETEEYIQANKHLPEIPSAKEMEANGVELGAMNMLLLKKIEELTLYQIDLLKKLEAQNKRIEQLEKVSSN